MTLIRSRKDEKVIEKMIEKMIEKILKHLALWDLKVRHPPMLVEQDEALVELKSKISKFEENGDETPFEFRIY
jgi:hypothetical protein